MTWEGQLVHRICRNPCRPGSSALAWMGAREVPKSAALHLCNLERGQSSGLTLAPGGGPSSLRLENLGTAACSVEGLSEQGRCWQVWGQRKTIAFTLLPHPPRSKNPLGSSFLTVSNWGCILGPRLCSRHVKGAQ